MTIFTVVTNTWLYFYINVTPEALQSLKYSPSHHQRKQDTFSRSSNPFSFFCHLTLREITVSSFTQWPREHDIATAATTAIYYGHPNHSASMTACLQGGREAVLSLHTCSVVITSLVLTFSRERSVKQRPLLTLSRILLQRQ